MTQDTQDNQIQFRPLPIVLMVVVLATVALGGWWLKSQPSSPALNAAGMNGTMPQNVSPPQDKVELTLFVPNDNAMLEKQTVEDTATTSRHFSDLAKEAIALLIQRVPQNFPAGTRLLSVETKEDGTAILDFNSKFNDPSFWHGSALTLMATYSIVNSITALPADDFKPEQVQFLVQGEPIAVLGGLDVQDPLKPDMQWVQQN